MKLAKVTYLLSENDKLKSFQRLLPLIKYAGSSQSSLCMSSTLLIVVVVREYIVVVVLRTSFQNPSSVLFAMI